MKRGKTKLSTVGLLLAMLPITSFAQGDTAKGKPINVEVPSASSSLASLYQRSSLRSLNPFYELPAYHSLTPSVPIYGLAVQKKDFQSLSLNLTGKNPFHLTACNFTVTGYAADGNTSLFYRYFPQLPILEREGFRLPIQLSQSEIDVSSYISICIACPLGEDPIHVTVKLRNGSELDGKSHPLDRVTFKNITLLE